MPASFAMQCLAEKSLPLKILTLLLLLRKGDRCEPYTSVALPTSSFFHLFVPNYCYNMGKPIEIIRNLCYSYLSTKSGL